MTTAMVTAVSGLTANSAWLGTIASNVANMNDTAALPSGGSAYSGYQPVTVSFSANAAGGVNAQVLPLTPAYSPGYDPTAPLANAQGLVAVPNVDLATAAVDQKMALVGYRADASVIRVAEQMTKTLLDTVA
jgi:flagellar basal-body rod protein FlgC